MGGPIDEGSWTKDPRAGCVDETRPLTTGETYTRKKIQSLEYSIYSNMGKLSTLITLKFRYLLIVVHSQTFPVTIRWFP